MDVNAPTDQNNGASWEYAFIDLQDALDYTQNCECDEIWVAAGRYEPTVPSGDPTFELIEGIAMYGGFGGYERSIRERNGITNETILDGNDASCVVTVKDVSSSAVIDGFTVRNSTYYGIWCRDSSLTVANCKIADNHDGVYCISGSAVNIADCNIGGNGGHGVNCEDSNLLVSSCVVRGNNEHGINCDDGSTLWATYSIVEDNNDKGIYSRSSNATVSKCTIGGNSGDGIYSLNSTLMVSNSIVEDNGGNGIYHKAESEAGSLPGIITNNIIRGNSARGVHYYYIWAGEALQVINNWIHNNGRGIYIQEVDEPVLIRNNTVADNSEYGIVQSGGTAAPDIANCIVWGNTTGSLSGTFNSITYCCVENGGTSNGNINTDPCFVDAGEGNYHLDPNVPSPCIDRGDPDFSDYNETDIDGEIRLFDGDGNDIDRIDMGADEYYWSPADYNGDKIVNFLDYDVLASAWQTVDANVSLDDDNDVDYADGEIFCEDWLWEPAWTKGAEEMILMRGGAGFGEKVYAPAEVEKETSEEDTVVASPAELEPEQIEELIEWLEGILVNEQVKKDIGEENWEEFAEGIKRMIESLEKELEE